MDTDGGGSRGNKQNTLVNPKKKTFHRHTPEQIQRLEVYFKECPHPDEDERYRLCRELKLAPDQVKFWFQNKRTQSKAQTERSSNILLRVENENLKIENDAMLEELKKMICPTCGPPFGQNERDHNLQKLHLENAQLKEKRDQIANFIANHKEPTMVDSFGSTQNQQQQNFDISIPYGPDPNQQQNFDTSIPYRPDPSQQQNFDAIPYGPYPNQQQNFGASIPYGPYPNDQQNFDASIPYEPYPNQQQNFDASIPYGPYLNQQQNFDASIPYRPYLNQQQNFDASIPYGPDPNHFVDTSNSQGASAPQPKQPPPLPNMDVMLLSEIAASAVEELKRLFFTEEPFWVKSSIDGTDVIDQGNYEMYLHSTRHFKNVSARVESSKDFGLVHMEATELVRIFLDLEAWKTFFPTIVNKANMIYALGSNLPTTQNCNVLQVIWEQLHILSPLVPPREFMILRCCQQIDHGLWIVADVSHNIIGFDLIDASCHKRPSGCIIQALPNEKSMVFWIEHVEVNDRSDTHPMYREILCGRSGYGAKRWLVTLQRMCERIALSQISPIPAHDFNDFVTTLQGRRCVMKLGERMLKNFNEVLTMSGKVDFPQHSKGGVRVGMRHNDEDGIPVGFILCAATSFSIPITPFKVFNFLRNLNTRHLWDTLCTNSIPIEIARISTGSGDNNYVSIIKPVDNENNGKNVAQGSDEKQETLMLQDCYMDELGGMLVYTPIDMSAMREAISGLHHPSKIEILPSGFIISSNGEKRSPMAASTSTTTAEECGGSVLTVALQILISAKASMSRQHVERSTNAVTSLFSSTVLSIKALLHGE